MGNHKLCIIKPNKSTYSETFIQAHIDRLSGDKRVIYGGAFPLYNHEGKLLICSKAGLLSYLIQKRFLRKLNISVRTNALANYLCKEKIDLVLAEYGYVGAMVLKACELAGVPLIIHYHGADAHHQPTVNKYKSLYQDAFDYASAIIVVSLDMKSALINLGAPPEKLVLNPYGVNTDVFKVVDVLNSAPNFLSVGRFVEKKSPLTTIRAFNDVESRYPDARLWMVGDGPLLAKAKDLASELNISNKITFTGVLKPSEIIALMQRMRCYIQHSVQAADGDMEGTPNTILEASAAGLPIVSTRHAGIKEAVVDGVTGYLVDEHDLTTMSEKMIELAASSELASMLGRNGRQHVLRNYNLPEQIGKLDRLIVQTIADKGRR